MEIIRCGVIGCGVIAPSHLSGLKNLPGVVVSAVCDMVEAKATAIARQYGVQVVETDYRKLLADPDINAISVCTDHSSHVSIVVEALRAGKHVICEKPLGISTRELDLMSETAAQFSHLVCAGVFQHRFEPVNRFVRALIGRGAFGVMTNIVLNSCLLRTDEYYLADPWRGTWSGEGGSLLINQEIHYLDLLDWFGGGIDSLCACCDNFCHRSVIETEDAAAVIMRFRNGVLGNVSATSGGPEDWRHTIILSGSRGYLEMRNDLIVYCRFSDAEIQREAEGWLHCDGVKSTPDGGKEYYGQGHPAQIKDFIDSIREHRRPYVTFADARRAVDVVIACYDSNRSGGWVKVGR